MAELSEECRRIVEDAAQRHGMSTDAVRAVLEALVASGGGMAQFNHPELGGMCQWSSGGMIMIGDMFNNGLKSRIAALCTELSAIVGRSGLSVQSSQWQSQGGGGSMPLPDSSFFVSGADRNWWPTDLGLPASTGVQNNLRYASFPDRRSLAVDVAGQVSVYDTDDHRITGFAQQQGGDQSLTFTSQHGTVRLDGLRLVSGSKPQAEPAVEASRAATARSIGGESDIFSAIERLGALRDKGLISEQEFAEKKTELLRRL